MDIRVRSRCYIDVVKRGRWSAQAALGSWLHPDATLRSPAPSTQCRESLEGGVCWGQGVALGHVWAWAVACGCDRRAGRSRARPKRHDGDMQCSSAGTDTGTDPEPDSSASSSYAQHTPLLQGASSHWRHLCCPSLGSFCSTFALVVFTPSHTFELVTEGEGTASPLNHESSPPDSFTPLPHAHHLPPTRTVLARLHMPYCYSTPSPSAATTHPST